MSLIRFLRKAVLVVLIIGLPIFIYLGFIADDPVFDPIYDVDIGRETVMSISQDTIEYPILSREKFPEAYSYMKKMVNEITTSPEVKYKDIFKYDSIQIIHRDDVLNAFCSPGGYVYVYTGLIHYLDKADDLAGVLGHEIAHAEMRHSAVGLQKEFGREKIMDYLMLQGIGLSAYIKTNLLKEMLSLDYSRDQEAESDRYSVLYLKDTKYACNGAAGFFEKLVAEGQDVNIPEFLSDHPDSKARIKSINEAAKEYGCNTEARNQTDWEIFKTLIPPQVDQESETINNEENEIDNGESIDEENDALK